MKKIITLTTLLFLLLSKADAIEIERIEPAFWWTDMKNPELQILVYGKNIAQSKIEINYKDVRLKETVQVENPNFTWSY